MSDLSDYLEYYAGLQSPGFAVLVTGDWGSGKTHQVRAALRANEPPTGAFYRVDPLDPSHHVYVSLHGMSDASEIYAKIAVEADRDLNGNLKIARTLMPTSFRAGGFGFDLSAGTAVASYLTERVLSKLKGRIIVLDDLERFSAIADSSVRAGVHGVVSHLVERLGCHVVLIAHDENLVADFAAEKEKIIGQTLKIEPEWEEAFDAFLRSQNSNQPFIAGPKSELISALRDGIPIGEAADDAEDEDVVLPRHAVKSLRVRRGILQDLSRWGSAIEAADIHTVKGFSNWLSSLALLDGLVRTGVIQRSDVFGDTISQSVGLRMERSDIQGSSPEEDQKRNEIDQKLAILDLVAEVKEGLFNSDVMLEQLLFDGWFESETFRGALTSSSRFAVATELAAWRVVAGRALSSQTEFATAFTRMERQFAQRDFQELGELLHVFALRLKFAEDGLNGAPISKVKAECEAYVQDWMAAMRSDAAKLTAAGLEYQGRIDTFGHYGLGLATGGYGDAQSVSGATLAELIDFIANERDRAFEADWPSQAERLMSVAQEDFFAAASLLEPYNGAHSQPFLRVACAEKFLDAIISNESDGFNDLRRALGRRAESRLRTTEAPFWRNLGAYARSLLKAQPTLLSPEQLHTRMRISWTVEFVEVRRAILLSTFGPPLPARPNT